MPRPIQPKPNKDHWGFYQVGPYKTYSKLDAIEVSGRTKHNIVWNFNNEVFSRFDWTQEPPGDLDFWYRQRAEQLREHYDYIILFFSGGWDTQNILRVFVENNIFIDEILHITTLYGNKNTRCSYEIFEYAAPYVKNLIETNPTYKKTKQTFVDVTDHEIDFLKKEKWDYFYETNSMLNPAINMMSEIREKTPGIIETHEKHQRVCQIYGLEKPKVTVDEYGTAKLTFFETSTLSNVRPSQRAKNLPDAHDEMFYWTPDLPELACKQAHVLHRYLKGIGDHSIDDDHKKTFVGSNRWLRRASGIKRGDYVYELSDKAVTNVIYKNCTPINLGPKPVSHFFGTKDDWLWDPRAHDVGQKRFVKGLLWLKQTVVNSRPDMWWNKPGDPSRGILPSGGFMPIDNQYLIFKGTNT